MTIVTFSISIIKIIHVLFEIVGPEVRLALLCLFAIIVIMIMIMTVMSLIAFVYAVSFTLMLTFESGVIEGVLWSIWSICYAVH